MCYTKMPSGQPKQVFCQKAEIETSAPKSRQLGTKNGVPLKCPQIRFLLMIQWQGCVIKHGVIIRATLNQSPQRTADAVPVRLNPLGQNDVNNRLACVAWLAHLAQAQGKLFSVQFGRARRRRVWLARSCRHEWDHSCLKLGQIGVCSA